MLKEHKKIIPIGIVIGQLSYGGAEKQQVYELVTRLDKERFRPTVFCLSESDEPYGRKIRKQNISVYLLKRRSSFDVPRLLKLAYLLRKEKIELVHSILYVATAYSYLACKLAGIKRLIPSILGYEKRESAIIRMFNRLAINSSKKIITNSLDLKNYLVKYIKADASKIITIPNGIDIDLFNKRMDKNLIRRNIGIEPKHKVVGIISKDSRAKNVSLFIEAAKSLLEQTNNICFVLIGMGLDNKKKEKWLNGFPLKDKFFFLGTREDIPELLSILDIFALTSISEGLPNVIMEAMAAGKPVIATDVGGCSELISNGKTGFLVPSNDKNELTKTLRIMLRNEKKTHSMGSAGRNFIKTNFSMNKMVRQTQGLYLEI